MCLRARKRRRTAPQRPRGSLSIASNETSDQERRDQLKESPTSANQEEVRHSEKRDCSEVPPPIPPRSESLRSPRFYRWRGRNPSFESRAVQRVTVGYIATADTEPQSLPAGTEAVKNNIYFASSDSNSENLTAASRINSSGIEATRLHTALGEEDPRANVDRYLPSRSVTTLTAVEEAFSESLFHPEQSRKSSCLGNRGPLKVRKLFPAPVKVKLRNSFRSNPVSPGNSGNHLAPFKPKERLSLSASPSDHEKAGSERIFKGTESRMLTSWEERLDQQLPSLCAKSWYFHDISREGAEEILANQPEGTYLVRQCRSRLDADFALSIQSSLFCAHSCIPYREDGFEISMANTVYNQGRSQLCDPDLEKLVRALVEGARKGGWSWSGKLPGGVRQPLVVTCPAQRTPTLKEFCRAIIRRHVSRRHLDDLPLPRPMKDYLKVYLKC